jgi:hypothetical protein
MTRERWQQIEQLFTQRLHITRPTDPRFWRRSVPATWRYGRKSNRCSPMRRLRKVSATPAVQTAANAMAGRPARCSPDSNSAPTGFNLLDAGAMGGVTRRGTPGRARGGHQVLPRVVRSERVRRRARRAGSADHPHTAIHGFEEAGACTCWSWNWWRARRWPIGHTGPMPPLTRCRSHGRSPGR